MNSALPFAPPSPAEIVAFRNRLAEMEAALYSRGASATQQQQGVVVHNEGLTETAPPPTASAPTTPVHAQTETLPSVSPLTQAYTSVLVQPRNQGHPVPFSLPQPTSFQPFAGAGALLPPQSTQLASQARRASALSTIPGRNNAGLPRRARGPSQRPPSLPSRPTVENCFVIGARTQTARITVKVYPPKDVPHDFVFYLGLNQTFNAFLTREDLIYSYDIALSTPILSLIGSVVRDMELKGFTFAPQHDLSTHEILVVSETQRLRLLEAVNRGRIRPRDGAAHLRPSSFDNRKPLGELIRMSTTFGLPICVEGSRFVIHFYVVHDSLEHNWNGGSHRCLSDHLYGILPDDSVVDSAALARYEAFECECDTENTPNALDQQEDPVAAIASVPHSSQVPVASARGSVLSRLLADEAGMAQEEGEIDELLLDLPDLVPPQHNTRALTVPGSRNGLTRQMSTATADSVIPSSIWNEPWSAEPVPASFNMNEFREQIYTAIHPNRAAAPMLRVHGHTVAELASALTEEVASAILAKDFSRILSPSRRFEVLAENHTISFGEGIEREAIYHAFLQYASEKKKLRWLVEQADNMHTLCVQIPAHSRRFVSESRKLSLEIFGALCAIMMINGQTPEPLDPCIIQYLIHHQDLRSLTERFVGEWHPELRQTIKNWKEVGPQGNIQFSQGNLGSYVNLAHVALEDRDEGLHEAFAGQILFHTVFGHETTNHPEWQAFISGFNLPCSNGSTFTESIRRLEGGSESYLNFIWASRTISAESLDGILVIVNPPEPYRNRLAQTARPNGPPGRASFGALLDTYLSGSGIPSEQLFNEVEHVFDGIVDLSKISTPGFRARMLVWAATGSPFLGIDPPEIRVTFVHDDDDQYLYGFPSEQRAAFISEGKICFRTCFRSAFIPATYVIKLAERDYENVPQGHPSSFKVAFDHWILTETLCSIGGHTVL